MSSGICIGTHHSCTLINITSKKSTRIREHQRLQISDHDKALNTYRLMPPFAGMYYYYHYDLRVKQIGSETICWDVTAEYIQFVTRVQQKLQEELERRGIIIECNPSSNVLIGTFRDYINHPIFRFYNSGLEIDPIAQLACPQMQVCINTDDLGVFETSLEFEYALLFSALSNQTNLDGSKKYKEEKILQYLESVRVMGHHAIFPKADLSKSLVY